MPNRSRRAQGFRAAYPEYLTDGKIFACPSSARMTEADMVRDDGTSILDGDINRWDFGDTIFNSLLSGCLR
jgi:hypothetical protein